MERFSLGHVQDGVYRVDSILSESERAHVYGVTHVRFPEAPLALKVPMPSRVLEFERDTKALASLASSTLARICDVGKLADGRMYRVVERLSGPTLREAVVRGEGRFSDERAMEVLVALAETVHEAHANGIGPCDLTLDNLMFADGADGRLCMLRVLVAGAAAPNNEADHVALTRLKQALTLDTRGMRPSNDREPWKPPSSVREIREAMAKTGGKRAAPVQAPGAKIDDWTIVAVLSETLTATVYDVTGANGLRAVLKVAGPRAKHDDFTRKAYLLAQIADLHVVRVHDIGTFAEAPYFVLDWLQATQANRLEASGPMRIEEAVKATDEMLAGAAAIAAAGGGPADFALDHSFIGEQGRTVLTHPLSPLRRYGVHGSAQGQKFAETWSAAVALYEMLSGRLPFPTSKHSLAKAWMGVPMPLAGRRRDVPRTLSTLVNDLLTGDISMTIAELRGTLGPLRGPSMRPNATPRMDEGSRQRALDKTSLAPPLAPRASAPPAARVSAPPAPPPRTSAPPPELRATMFHGSMPPPNASQLPPALAATDPQAPPAPDWRLDSRPRGAP